MSLSPVIESIRSVKMGVDKATIDLSAIRLLNEITGLQATGKTLRSKRNKLFRLLFAEIPLLIANIFDVFLTIQNHRNYNCDCNAFIHSWRL